ncbi:hypothetical protein [Kitasatospora sp. NBC_01539]|uniref:hypothetical protein n=1 Tax=Kitasatospora sp. NBC_01539 TaxID=2903577 RepID=UPI0038602CC3
MSDEARRIPPLRAGRRPAGLALLGWLADDRAPRLCRVSGSAGSGKTHLLRWLADGCSGEDLPEHRRVHALLDGERLTVPAALWLLGRRLGHPAHSPDELFSALADDGRRAVICVPDLGRAVHPSQLIAQLLAPLVELPNIRLVVEAPDGGVAAAAFGLAVEHPAVLDLDHEQWTDRERFASWAVRAGGDPAAYPHPSVALGRAVDGPPESGADLIARIPRHPDGSPDLAAADEALLSDLWTAAARDGSAAGLLADPQLLTRAHPVAVTAALEGLDGALPAAWATAGPALAGEPDPGVRAAVLRTRLIGMDDAAAGRLAEVPAPWQAAWAMWPGSSAGWPGAVAGLAVGAGPTAGQLLLADPGGTIRTVEAGTGRPLARVERPGTGPLRALAVTPDGTVVVLDAQGVPGVVPAEDAPTGAAAVRQALDVLGADARGGPSALAAVGPEGVPALADGDGTVRRLHGGAVVAEHLHEGPVTALAGSTTLLVSGGFDGAVRLWGAAAGTAAPDPLDRRTGAVSAVAAADTPAGPVVAAAWADGLVRLWRPGADGPLDLRLGSPVWALALADGLLVAGTAEGVAAVRY